jgi:hypothetical protein
MNVSLSKLSVERLEEIERERAQTTSDPLFMEWFKQLNVSRLHNRREGIDEASRMMSMWMIKDNFSIFK